MSRRMLRTLRVSPGMSRYEMHTSTLADQRGIPVDSNDDLFRDQNTARDARNAVEQVISHVYPEAAAMGNGPVQQRFRPQAQRYSRGNQPVRRQAITLSPDEVEEAPLPEADTARQNYGDFLDRVGTRVAWSRMAKTSSTGWRRAENPQGRFR